MNETHTYPDGSARVGCPPFPKLSPLEEARGVTEAVTESVEAEIPAPEHAKRGRKPKAEAE